MTRTDRLSKHADKAFAHADEAFKNADAAFEEAEKIFASLPKGSTYTQSTYSNDAKVHTVRFTGRWKLAWKFFCMGCVALFTGKTELRFKDKK